MGIELMLPTKVSPRFKSGSRKGDMFIELMADDGKEGFANNSFQLIVAEINY